MYPRSLSLAVIVLSAWTIIPSLGSAGAVCVVEAPADAEKHRLIKHLSAGCSPAERETHAVSGAAIMDAVKKGRAIDLVGVLVQGDLSFDGLPVQATRMPKGLTAEQEAALAQLNAEELRLVAAPVVIRDSAVSGAVRHRSAKGTLQFEGPVDLHGTAFRQGVDLSRSVFQGAVDLSETRFEREAYFVQSQFAHALRCRDAKFGPHTRFHRSTFRGPVDCAGALFDGMAEFLEVTFEQPVVMERVRFGSGTGFSGSRFQRHANFADAIFSRDSFFSFTLFEGDVSFAGAQFLGGADFSDAQFKRPDDLTRARFDQKPIYTRTKRVTEERPAGLLSSPSAQYAVTLFFLLMAAFLVAYAFKMK
jgi:uncharacterized protein YjbI with pentapeptide repeats